MKRSFTILTAAFMLLAFLAIPMGMMGQTRTDEVLSTCRFGASYNPNNSGYTGTFTVTNGEYTWTIGNGNNNNNGWTNGDGYGQVKFGRKNTASVGYITTDAAYSEAVTKVELTIDAFTSGKINSVKLYTGTSTTSMTEAGSFAVAIGTQTVALSTPATGLYYKIEFDCAAGSANGLITVSKVDYYHSTGGNPVVVTPTFTPNGASFLDSQEVSIACATDGATIYYTLDGSDPTTSSTEYTAPFTLTQTTTVKAIGVKADYDNSAVASAVFTKQAPMTVAEARTFIDGLNGATSDDVYVIGTISQIDSYNSNYHSITYWISDDGTTTDQMEVYSGKGLNGADFSSVTDLTLGSEVVVKGKVKLYGSTYEFTQNSQIISLTLPSNPYITAEDVEITYDTDEDEIEYTIHNPVSGGVLTASTTSDWLTLGEVGSTIPFTCSVNTAAGARTATITLTYTYGRTAVTTDLTVTQAGNPNFVNNISDITETGTSYSVRGTVVATNSRGFVMGDGTGYVYYYKNAAPTQSVNDIVKVSGTTGTYGHIIQFTNTATVEAATTSSYNNTPAATLITAVPDYSEGYHLSTYLEFEGTLAKSSSNYLITLGESQIQISYPTSDQGTTLTALDGKTVHVKGYFTGINSSGKFTVMLESVEEVVVPVEEYTLTVSNLSHVNLFVFGDDENETLINTENGETTAQVANGTSVGISIDVETGYEIESLVVDGNDVTSQIDSETGMYTFTMPTHDVTITASAIEYIAPTGGTITFGSAEGSTKINAASVTGNDSMGNTWTITTEGTTSFTQNSSYSQVGSSSKPATSITFTTTLPTEATVTSFEAKFGGFSSTAGTITLKVDETTVGTGSLDATNDIVVSNTSVASGTTLTITVTDIAKGVKCYYISYVFSTSATETHTLEIAGYGNSDGGYYLIASPVAAVTPSAENGFITDAYDLYWFDQTQDKEWQNYKSGTFSLVSGMGYLYASQEGTTLTFEGTPYNGDGSVSLVKDDEAQFSGWNLVGNPFGVSAYINRDFYIMNPETGAELIQSSGEIAPMQGIFVIANEDGENLTFTTEAPGNNNEKLVLNVTRNRGNVIDRAIVRFGQGGMLPKFQLNENNTKISIVEGETEYAVVRSANEGEMPVSFKASENGRYTISVNAENIEMEYLHLIDNMTGANVDLLATPSYSFEANTTDYTSRFRLVFSANSNDGSSTSSETFAFFNGSNWVVNNEGEATLQVIDMTGRMLSSEQINGSYNKSLNLSAGVYVLRLSNGNVVKTQKVVID